MLFVPGQIVNILDDLYDLPKAQRKAFVEALDSVEVLHASDFASNLAKQSQVAVADVARFLMATRSMYRAMRSMDLSVSDFAKEMGSVLASKRPVTPKKLDEFQAEIAVVLNSKVVSFVNKAVDVIWDQQRLFLGSRILTDIRPIFDDEDDPTLQGIALTHTLKLSYKKNGEARDFFITLDPVELEELQEDIDRALRKQEKLSEAVQVMEIPLVVASGNPGPEGIVI